MVFNASELERRIKFAVARIKFVDSHLRKDPDNEALKFSLDFEVRSFEYIVSQLAQYHPEIARKIKERQHKFFETN